MNSERILAHIFVKPAFRPSLALIAEGKKQSMILQAEAEKESAIQKAKGEAEAILEVQQAKAQGLRMLREANIDDATICLRSLEAFEKAADGKASKIIIPSDIQSLAGFLTSAVEIAKGTEK